MLGDTPTAKTCSDFPLEAVKQVHFEVRVFLVSCSKVFGSSEKLMDGSERSKELQWTDKVMVAENRIKRSQGLEMSCDGE